MFSVNKITVFLQILQFTVSQAACKHKKKSGNIGLLYI